MRRNAVLSALKQAEPALRARGVAGLYIFGSIARDEAGPSSDVDVFIGKDTSRKFGFDEFMDVYFLLQERLGTGVITARARDFTRCCGPRSSGRRSGLLMPRSPRISW